MDEAIKNVLLQGLVVIFHVLPLANFKGVVTVRENDGRQVMLIVQEVTAMKVSDGNSVFTPEGQSAKRID